MNIFENYLEKIKTILVDLSNKGELVLPNKLNSIIAELPPPKFKSDISTNVAMVLAKLNNKNLTDFAFFLSEKIKQHDQSIEKISVSLNFNDLPSKLPL